jgi:FtsH-binding integral membrane protein
MAKQTRTSDKSAGSRLENILAFMAVGLIGTSILVMVATLILSLSSTSLWPIMVFYPQLGLIAGAACIIALLIVNLRRRSRENASN